MAIDIFETRTLFGAINEGRFGARAYFRDRFFNRIKTFVTENIDFDLKDAQGRKLAPFVNPRIGGQVVNRLGFHTETYKVPLVAPEMVTTADELLKRMAGESVYGSKTPEQRALEIAQDNMLELEKMITRREEAMCAQALFEGKINVKGEGVDDIVDFWASLKPADKPTATSATYWDDASIDGQKIMEEIRKYSRERVKKSGFKPREIFCGSKVIDVLIPKLSEKELLNGRRVDLGEIRPQELPDGLHYWGYLRDAGIDIYSYDEYYENAEGKMVPMVPENKVLFAASEVETTMAYGAVCIADKPKNMMEWYAARRVPHSYIQERPAARIIQLNARPLPIVNQVQGFSVLQPLA